MGGTKIGEFWVFFDWTLFLVGVVKLVGDHFYLLTHRLERHLLSKHLPLWLHLYLLWTPLKNEVSLELFLL